MTDAAWVSQPAMRRIHRIHLVGIGGTGMGGIAEVLHTLGYHVTGSDTSKNAMVERLCSLGIVVHHEHKAEHSEGADVVVVSTAIRADNPEVVAAKTRRIPVVPRAMMLSELMRFRQGIAIAGAHGKTTTTSLVASLLAEGGHDPTFVIGGKLNATSSNAKLGAGDYFVAEADESDASFLYLSPMTIVLTNIDQDHLEAYDNNYENLKAAYVKFLHRLPFYGLAIVCMDDAEIRGLLPNIQRPYLTYGFHADADFRIIHYRQIGIRSEFTCLRPDAEPMEIRLNLPGEHNALNALAAIAVATEQGVHETAIKRGLSEFQGVGRRFQLLGILPLPGQGQALFIDDYGHHPNEIAMVIKSAKVGWPGQRLVMVYQPHRYSRLKALFQEFVQVLSDVDELFVLDVYSAGEAAIPEYNSETLCQHIQQYKRGHQGIEWQAHRISDKAQLSRVLGKNLNDNDIVLMQGAGDINNLSGELLQKGLVS